jgi:hypothetical protein
MPNSEATLNPQAKPDVPDNTPKLSEHDAENPQVATPDGVGLPLPKQPAAGIAVPASINGRDLSRGGP